MAQVCKKRGLGSYGRWKYDSSAKLPRSSRKHLLKKGERGDLYGVGKSDDTGLCNLYDRSECDDRALPPGCVKQELQNSTNEVENLIYPGAQITVMESILLIYNLNIKHNLTSSALCDILDIIRLHTPNELPFNVQHLESVYLLKKAFGISHSDGLTVHHVCEKCKYWFEDPALQHCPVSGCNADRYFEGTTIPRSFFIEVDIEEQIKQLFQDEEITRDIESVSQRKHVENTDICDVYDGELYKNLSNDPNFKSSPHNITLTWHIDGASVFHSSNVSIWPLQSVVNELPPHKRFKKDNVLLLGLWFGSGKPCMTSYLQPIARKLNQLSEKGLQVHPQNRSPSVCRVYLLLATMDLPAMAMVRDMHQFNGEYGCGMCEERGESVSKGRGQCRAYPPPTDLAKVPLRTKERVMQYAQTASESGKVVLEYVHQKRSTCIFDTCCEGKPLAGPCYLMLFKDKNHLVNHGEKVQKVNGIKGFSSLLLISNYDPVRQVLIDYLHGVCLGIMKNLFTFWFDARYKGSVFWIGDQLERIDAKLLSIRPTDEVTRPPRSIQKDRSHFKASEYRNFLLLYGPHVLMDILHDDYYLHFLMLSRGVSILLANKISEADLAEASNLLLQFYCLHGSYYERAAWTLNVHNTCIHLVECVRLGGPLWAFGCFGFESFCGEYVKMIHGTQHIALQIISAFRAIRHLRTSVNLATILNSEVDVLLHEKPRIKEDLGNGIFVASPLQTVTDPEILALVQQNIIHFSAIKQFGRLVKGRTRVTGHRHEHSKKRSNSVIEYQDVEGRTCFGLVETFLIMFPKVLDEKKRAFALVQSMRVTGECPFLESSQASSLAEHQLNIKLLSAQAKYVERNGRLILIPCKNILRKVLLIYTSDQNKATVMRFPNDYEHD